MTERTLPALALAVGLVVSACSGDAGGQESVAAVPTVPGPRFTEPTVIDNPFYPLSSFQECTYEGREGGADVRGIRTRLDRTERITWQGRSVDAVVIRHREFEDEELIEETLDYFAQSDDGAVYYLGEDVDTYENGVVVDHHGQWRVGRETEVPGVIMAAEPTEGTWFRPEDVPPITLEQDIVIREGQSLTVAGGSYDDVIVVREILAPDGDVEFKYYARGTGVIREEPPDGRVDLVSCT
jgi:hypothetical protein